MRMGTQLLKSRHLRRSFRQSDRKPCLWWSKIKTRCLKPYQKFPKSLLPKTIIAKFHLSAGITETSKSRESLAVNSIAPLWLMEMSVEQSVSKQMKIHLICGDRSFHLSSDNLIRFKFNEIRLKINRFHRLHSTSKFSNEVVSLVTWCETFLTDQQGVVILQKSSRRQPLIYRSKVRQNSEESAS